MTDLSFASCSISPRLRWLLPLALEAPLPRLSLKNLLRSPRLMLLFIASCKAGERFPSILPRLSALPVDYLPMLARLLDRGIDLFSKAIGGAPLAYRLPNSYCCSKNCLGERLFEKRVVRL